jgi:hypothetical protein
MKNFFKAHCALFFGIIAVVAVIGFSMTACDNGDSPTPVITTSSLPNGTVGEEYSQTLTATGDTPITWSKESGELPNGLTLSTAGVISGTPTTANTFNITVKAANAAGNDTKALAITITSAPIPVSIAAISGVTIPVRGKPPVTAITETAQYSGTVTWNNNPSTFAPNTVYTAVITLTVKSGYTLQGVTADFFTVAGAVQVNNSANTGVITAVFPVTGWEKVFEYRNSTMGSYFDLLDYCPYMVSSDITFNFDT